MLRSHATNNVESSGFGLNCDHRRIFVVRLGPVRVPRGVGDGTTTKVGVGEMIDGKEENTGKWRG